MKLTPQLVVVVLNAHSKLVMIFSNSPSIQYNTRGLTRIAKATPVHQKKRDIEQLMVAILKFLNSPKNPTFPILTI